MISQETIDEVRAIQQRYLAEAMEHVSESGHITGDKYVYSRLVKEARRFAECADALEAMRANSEGHVA